MSTQVQAPAVRRDLGALITAETLSSLGTQVTWLALPWFVLTTSGSPTRMGVVFAAELIPIALLGLPSGSLVARWGARTTMLRCDAARALLVAAFPTLHQLGVLSFPLLMLLVRWFSVNSSKTYRRVREFSAMVIVHFVETMTGIRAVQAYRREPRNSEIFEDLSRGFRDVNVRSFRLVALFMPGVKLIGNIAIGVVLAWLGITPFGLWLGLRDFAHAIVANGFRGLHDIGRYILTGAAIVIPVWLVLRLLDSRRS